ncbi:MULTISPECIES: HAMP domain-containing sensor histidine kinase [unclassified Variovorax]|uniref:sensor histidine kinase n=1 Tax=unclassified Variovorax TaxID=663243 RepID=UPI00210E927F|nr:MULTISPECIES: HAMP domain-containing sensor histidine kinase [unclassified Variovorax]
MRLKAENALAAAPKREGQALQAIVGQIDRLDGLMQSLLALVQPVTLAPREVVLHRWLDERVAAVAGVQVTLRHDTPASAVFDPMHLARALDNPLDNAVRHAPRGGHVVLCALQPDARTLAIRVDDDGPGVPESLQACLFEPFATGRADGTGLGLALAHGGKLHHRPPAPSTRFELKLLWCIP